MIKIIRTLTDFVSLRKNIDQELSIGLVPTMGNLHKGHLSLIEKSLQDNAYTIITIFVNPKQFSPNEDLSKYPRTLDQDIVKIKEIAKEKNIILFSPIDNHEIYPNNFDTNISVGQLSKCLCGKTRTGHFDGVATVVYLLLSITRPTIAYFGQKDYQQFQIIKRMVKDLNLIVQIKMLPIIRDHNGLALSSRNQYLSSQDYKTALILPQSIQQISNVVKQNFNLQFIKNNINKIVQRYQGWEYLEFLDANTLRQPNQSTKLFLVAGALQCNETRIIDNNIIRI